MEAVAPQRRVQDKPEAPWAVPGVWLLPAFLALAWALDWAVGAQLHPLAGLRFVALWLLPLRRATMLAVAEALMWAALGWRDGAAMAALSGMQVLAEWGVAALMIRNLLQQPRASEYASIARIRRLQVVVILVAFSTALAAAIAAFAFGQLSLQNLPPQVFRGGLERCLGMLMMVSALFAMAERPFPWNLWKKIGKRLLMWIPYFSCGVLLLHQVFPSMHKVAFLLPLPPLVDILLMFGWRGGMPLVCSMAALVWPRRIFGEPVTEDDLAVILVIGNAALMLGMAVETLRNTNRRLRDVVAREQRIGVALADRTASLRELGRRMIRAREDEQIRIAQELHDELGQLATALGARLGLIEARAGDAALQDDVHAAQEVARRLREAIRQAASRLHPPLMDRFGLAVALQEGPIADLLHTAGVEYDVEVSGVVEQLDDDIAIAIYRICQEAATNCVRHADAGVFQVRLRVAKRHDGRLSVRLTASDDGQGIGEGEIPSGNGLRGIADRVLALSGDHGFASSAEGTRHEVTLVVESRDQA